MFCTGNHPFATVERFGHWYYSRGQDKSRYPLRRNEVGIFHKGYGPCHQDSKITHRIKCRVDLVPKYIDFLRHTKSILSQGNRFLTGSLYLPTAFRSLLSWIEWHEKINLTRRIFVLLTT